jgi:hypothetical protein
MISPEYLRYFAFGISIAFATYCFAISDHLWKKRFFRKLQLVGAVLFAVGITLDIFRLVDSTPGVVSVTAAAAIIYLTYFSLFRYLYKLKFSVEPYVTSASSTVGAPQLDMFGSASKDGKAPKYSSDRKITVADFAFSFLQALVPAFTIVALVGLAKWLN